MSLANIIPQFKVLQIQLHGTLRKISNVSMQKGTAVCNDRRLQQREAAKQHNVQKRY